MLKITGKGSTPAHTMQNHIFYYQQCMTNRREYGFSERHGTIQELNICMLLSFLLIVW